MSIEFTPPYALKDQELISNLFPSKEEVIGSKKEGQGYSFRQVSRLILYDPDSTKVALGHFKIDNWCITLGGGVDVGETPEKAALRELAEESGYYDIRNIVQLGSPIRTYFFRDIYKERLATPFLVILNSHKCNQISLTATEKSSEFICVWYSLRQAWDILHFQSAHDDRSRYQLEVLKRAYVVLGDANIRYSLERVDQPLPIAA
jgi:hypothetical protein